jgi:hypothetical protein
MRKGKYPHLTDRQTAYAMETLLGTHPVEAARISGYAFPDVQYASVESKPAVQAVIGIARMRRDQKIAKVSEELEDILKNKPKDPMTWNEWLRGQELLAKVNGLLSTEGGQKPVNFNFFDVKDANPQQLWLKLQEIQQQKLLQREVVDVQEPQEQAKSEIE